MNEDGSAQRNLSEGGGRGSPAVSSDGGRIAFVSTENSSSGKTEVWVMDFDGTNMEMITETDAPSGSPSWSPDGSQIAFTGTSEEESDECDPVAWPEGCNDVFVLKLESREIRNLTREPARTYLAAWAPDGTQVAFVRSKTERTGELWVVNVDGSDLRQLTRNAQIRTKPSWSPDGSRLAYSNLGDGSESIWLVDVGGSTPVEISNECNWMTWPAWSPDGDRISYSCWSEGDRDSDIWTMNVDGTDSIQLTHEPAEYTYISWIRGDDVASVVERLSWGRLKASAAMD